MTELLCISVLRFGDWKSYAQVRTRQTSLSSSQVAGEEAPQGQGRAESLMHTAAKRDLQEDRALANTLAVRGAR